MVHFPTHNGGEHLASFRRINRPPIDSNPMEFPLKTLSPFSQAVCKVFYEGKNVMEHVELQTIRWTNCLILQLRWNNGGDIVIHVGGIYPLYDWNMKVWAGTP